MGKDLGRALSIILNSVVSPDGLDELLKKACGELSAIEGYDRVGVALFDTEQKAFVERVVFDCGEQKECTCCVNKSQIPYSEENLLGQAIIHNLPYAYSTSDNPCKSEVVLPLNSRNNLIGALSILSNDKERFKEMDFEKLTDFGRILSVAIENRILSSSGQDFSSKDTLTGLFSQRYLRARISHEIERIDRFGGVFSLAITEIDNFTEVRKKYGHQITGEALKEISKKLTENLREVDVAARYGEKEFAVVLPHADKDQALRAAERIREVVGEIDFNFNNNEKIELTVSSGIAVYPDDSPFKDGLLEAADMALAKARNLGRAQIFTYAELAREQGIITSE